MTLEAMIRTALMQLDEAPEDAELYAELFTRYANEGYREAWQEHERPVRRMLLKTDERTGHIRLPGRGMRVTAVYETAETEAGCGGGGDGPRLTFVPDADGHGLTVREAHVRGKTVAVMAARSYPPLAEAGDEPMIPEHAHGAICDYICYRHLLNGGPSGQARAGAYLQAYLRTMHRLERPGRGSTAQMHGLYASTGLRR